MDKELDLHHLRYFVAVAERLHFAEAAEFVHVSQPGLSQQIKALEEEVGVLLLDRTKRTVTLVANNLVAGTATKLRASDGAKLGTFPVGSFPFGVAFDGAHIWVANGVSNSVSKLSPK
jgi:hypothetical protein